MRFQHSATVVTREVSGETVAVPPAASPLSLSIGNVPLSLYIPLCEAADDTLRERAVGRYAEFHSQSSQGLSIYFRPRPAAKMGPVVFTYDLGHASIVLRTRGAEFLGVRNEYDLDSLLRVLLSMVLLQQDGFLLHAATIVRDGKAYVFAGRSGAGKSTASALSPAGSVLTDEISLLRRYDGHWFAHGTPFWGEFHAGGRNERYPLSGVYALQQALEDRTEPLSTKEAFRALLRCVLFFAREQRPSETLLTILGGLTAQVPCRRLHFRRSAEFWKVIP